jgi:hypothetical protein
MPAQLPDRLLTLREAADELGIPYFKVQRAARSGLIPTYSLFNSRKYVLITELLRVMGDQKAVGRVNAEAAR